MKRIGIYYENRIRNDGFPLYAFNLLKEYPEIEAHHLIPNGNYEKSGKMDANLWIDWGEDGLVNSLPYKVTLPTGAPLIYFSSDTHLGYEYRRDMCKKADYAYTAQKEGYEKMLKEGIKVKWLPHGVEPRAYPAEPKALKKYDVCFVGHIVSKERLDFLDRAFKEFPNFWFGSRISRYIKNEMGANDDCADIYKKSKIVLNPPTKGDCNMRLWEALSTGSFLITENVYGLSDMFENGKHLVTYKTVDEAMDKIRYYLKHDEEREKIAQDGMKLVLERGTYKQRLEVMLMDAGILPEGTIKHDHFKL